MCSPLPPQTAVEGGGGGCTNSGTQPPAAWAWPAIRGYPHGGGGGRRRSKASQSVPEPFPPLCLPPPQPPPPPSARGTCRRTAGPHGRGSALDGPRRIRGPTVRPSGVTQTPSGSRARRKLLPGVGGARRPIPPPPVCHAGRGGSARGVTYLGGGGGWHKALALGCLPLAPIGLSPLLLLALCGSKRVLVVSTEPLDNLSCLTGVRGG